MDQVRVLIFGNEAALTSPRARELIDALGQRANISVTVSSKPEELHIHPEFQRGIHWAVLVVKGTLPPPLGPWDNLFAQSQPRPRFAAVVERALPAPAIAHFGFDPVMLPLDPVQSLVDRVGATRSGVVTQSGVEAKTEFASLELEDLSPGEVALSAAESPELTENLALSEMAQAEALALESLTDAPADYAESSPHAEALDLPDANEPAGLALESFELSASEESVAEEGPVDPTEVSVPGLDGDISLDDSADAALASPFGEDLAALSFEMPSAQSESMLSDTLDGSLESAFDAPVESSLESEPDSESDEIEPLAAADESLDFTVGDLGLESPGDDHGIDVPADFLAADQAIDQALMDPSILAGATQIRPSGFAPESPATRILPLGSGPDDAVSWEVDAALDPQANGSPFPDSNAPDPYADGTTLSRQMPGMGDASPGTDATAVDTLRRFAALKEREVREREGTVEVLQKQLTQLRERLSRSEDERRRLTLELDDQKPVMRSLEDVRDQAQHHAAKLQSAHQEELRSMQLRVDNAQFSATRAERKLEEFRDRVRADILKIRMRERELANKLELQKRDAEALLQAKDERLLQQKREIDRLEFELENIKERMLDDTQRAEERAAKMSRALRSLKMAQGMLSGIEEEVLPNLNDALALSESDEDDESHEPSESPRKRGGAGGQHGGNAA